MTLRRIGAVAAGVVFFALFVSVMNRLALAVWPAYTAAFPTYSFSPAMLVTRLCMGAGGLIGAGYLVAGIARTERIAVIMAAALLLLLGGTIHLSEPTWSHFPLWYHIVFIGSIAPAVLLGGRLRRA